MYALFIRKLVCNSHKEKSSLASNGLESIMASVGADVFENLYNTRICSLEVVEMGPMLPCSRLSAPSAVPISSRLTDHMWDDVASLDVGRICPYKSQALTKEEDTKLVIRAIFELPYQTTIPTTGEKEIRFHVYSI